jgi:hypothetical protein
MTKKETTVKIFNTGVNVNINANITCVFVTEGFNLGLECLIS